MEMCYGSKGVSNYLDVQIGTEMEINRKGYQFQIRMLEENEIPYLMHPVRLEVDGVLVLKYELNAVYIVERMVGRLKPDGKLFAAWLSSILDCIAELEQYLLVPDNLVLSPDYMFYRCSDKTLAMLYIPGYERDIRLQMKCLMEYIMQRFDASDRAGIQFLYKAYELVCMENADIGDLRRYARTDNNNYTAEERGEKVTGVESVKPGESTKEEAKREAYMADEAGLADKVRVHISFGRIMILAVNLAAAVYMVFRYCRHGRQEADIWLAVGLAVVLAIHIIFCFGEQEDADEVMQEYGHLQDGTDLDAVPAPGYEQKQQTPSDADNVQSLVPLSNGILHEIRLGGVKEKCVVGRGREETDYRLTTTQISRVHACIYRKKEGIFIEDRDSTNGTYINAVRIPPMELRKLEKGDIVAFANEEFFVS